MDDSTAHDASDQGETSLVSPDESSVGSDDSSLGVVPGQMPPLQDDVTRGSTPRFDDLDVRQSDLAVGPVSVEMRQAEGGLVLPETVAFTLHQLNANIDTAALQGDLTAAAGGLATESNELGGVSADATVTVLGRYDINAHAEAGSLNSILDFMSEGRPVLLGVERSEFWYTVDDRGTGEQREPVRLGEWRSESDSVELLSATEPSVPLYEISKDAFLAQWREQQSSMVVVDEQAPDSSPAPVLLPIVLDAAAGVKQVVRG